MANLKVGKKFKFRGETVQVVSINADGTATLNYAAGSGKTGFAGKVALNVTSKNATKVNDIDFDTDDIEVDDAIVTLNSYNDFEIDNPVEKDSIEHMNAEEFEYYVEHLGYNPDQYWEKNKDDILAKRLEYAESINADRKSVAEYKTKSAAYDAKLLTGYQKDGYREFKLGDNRKFTDSNKYDIKSLRKAGFTDKDFAEINRPDSKGKEPSKELIEMRAAYKANEYAYEAAKQELANAKAPLFANDYDKWKPKYEAKYKAEEAYRKMNFYSEMVNRVEAHGSGYKPTGHAEVTSTQNKYGSYDRSYDFIDGGVPLNESLPEILAFRKAKEGHYAWMTNNNEVIFKKDKGTKESDKAETEAYNKFRKDFRKDWVAPEEM